MSAAFREQSGVYTHIAGANQDIVVKQGPGALVALVINQAGTTISVYDNVSGTGNPIALFTTAGPGTYAFNVRFNNGLHIVTTGNPDITISYV
jgi:hypothetical protein